MNCAYPYTQHASSAKHRNTKHPKLTEDALPDFLLPVEYGGVENAFSDYNN